MHQTTPGIAEMSIPPKLEHAALIDAIGQLIPAVRESDVTLSRRFYDSFDWRLFLAGASLEWRFSEVAGTSDSAWSPVDARPPARPRLSWRDLRKPHAMPIEQPLESEPGLLDELPAGPVRDRLAGLLEMRRLLPMVDVISQQTPLRLLNEDEKTVVRLLIEQNRFREPNSGQHGVLLSRLRLEPVRGYAEAFEQAREVLASRLGLALLDESMAQEALVAAGHRPGQYSTKLDQTLDPDQRADLATKQILRGLLATLEANIEGACQNLDSEFLHDLRVATRRTRSALSQIKGVFPESLVVDFKARFAWLQQITGPMRDLDVYLLDFPDMERRLPTVLSADLKPLHEQLVRQHLEAQRQLARELRSPTFSQLLRDWHRFLDEPVSATETTSPDLQDSPDAPPKQALWPIKRVADQRIRKMLKRVRAEGRAITKDSPPEDLHELRKSCKKLRYLMEFFQSLYPKDRIREQIKQTKLLLDNLGRFQDTAVQAQHLREHAESSAGGETLPARTLVAMGALISQLLRDQAQARATFGEVFATFDSAENAKRFKDLFVAHAHPQGALSPSGSAIAQGESQ